MFITLLFFLVVTDQVIKLTADIFISKRVKLNTTLLLSNRISIKSNEINFEL